MRRIRTLLLALLLCACAQKTPPGTSGQPLTSLRLTSPGGQIIEVRTEIAVDDATKERGLMFRTHLNADGGMLFPYDSPRTMAFWMKNTLIPLDMIFIGAGKTIVDIRRNAQPGDLSPYGSAAPAKYVLEVNGGWCGRKGILVGDPVGFDGY
jgi:hypothetical protein